MVERFVEREELLVSHVCGEIEAVETHALRAATVAQIFFPARVINEDAPHRFGGGGEEMRAVAPFGLIISAKPQPRLVNERGGLQSLSGIFARHLLRGQLAQFFINQREQLIRGVRVALVNALENDGEFAHAESVTVVRLRIQLQFAVGTVVAVSALRIPIFAQ